MQDEYLAPPPGLRLAPEEDDYDNEDGIPVMAMSCMDSEISHFKQGLRWVKAPNL